MENLVGKHRHLWGLPGNLPPEPKECGGAQTGMLFLNPSSSNPSSSIRIEGWAHPKCKISGTQSLLNLPVFSYSFSSYSKSSAFSSKINETLIEMVTVQRGHGKPANQRCARQQGGKAGGWLVKGEKICSREMMKLSAGKLHLTMKHGKQLPCR